MFKAVIISNAGVNNPIIYLLGYSKVDEVFTYHQNQQKSFLVYNLHICNCFPQTIILVYLITCQVMLLSPRDLTLL